MAKQIDWANLVPSIVADQEEDDYSIAQKFAALESVVGILHTDGAIDLYAIRDERLAKISVV